MTKKCNVLLSNDFVAVIDYDGMEIQVPAIKRKADVVKVLTDGTYTVVPDDYVEESVTRTATKSK